MTGGRSLIRAAGPFLCALLLAACSDADEPGAADNRALDNAAAMLDAAPAELERVEPAPPGNAAGD